MAVENIIARYALIIVLLSATLTFPACDILGLGSYAEPALIVFYGDTATIAAPDTVTVGEPFAVTVGTFGGGCTREVDRTELEVTGDLAEVRPYNRTQRSDVCTSDLLILAHIATIQFNEAGLATLRITGRLGGPSQTEPARLDRRITVR